MTQKIHQSGSFFFFKKSLFSTSLSRTLLHFIISRVLKSYWQTAELTLQDRDVTFCSRNAISCTSLISRLLEAKPFAPCWRNVTWSNAHTPLKLERVKCFNIERKKSNREGAKAIFMQVFLPLLRHKRQLTTCVKVTSLCPHCKHRVPPPRTVK